MATQTTTQQSRTRGTPAPPGAYPKTTSYQPPPQRTYPWLPRRSSSVLPTTPRRSTSAPPNQTSPPISPNPRQSSGPPGGSDPGGSGPDDDDVKDEGNDDEPPWEDNDEERNIWEGTPFPEEKKILNNREDFSGDVPHPPKNAGEGKFKEPAVFDDWALKFTDLLSLRGISLMDPKAIIRIGFYLEGKASEFHNRWR